jgi:hypothetical protein
MLIAELRAMPLLGDDGTAPFMMEMGLFFTAGTAIVLKLLS